VLFDKDFGSPQPDVSGCEELLKASLVVLDLLHMDNHDLHGLGAHRREGHNVVPMLHKHFVSAIHVGHPDLLLLHCDLVSLNPSPEQSPVGQIPVRWVDWLASLVK